MEGLKEAQFMVMQNMIEKAQRYLIEKKKDWKPFEYMQTIETIFRMSQQMVENRNWNASRMNPLVQINQANTQLNLYQQNNMALIEEPSSAMQTLRQKLKDEFKKD